MSDDFVFFRRGGNQLKCARRGKCTKRRYGSKAKAKKRVKRLNGTKYGCKYVYKCPLCGFWHLTSQLQENKNGNNKTQ